MHRILIVDDDDDFLDVISNILEKQDYYYKTAKTVFEARRILENQHDNHFDLVILDLSLPDQSGLEFIPDLKTYDHDIPIIMVSARSETQSVVKAMQEGASDYVTKPFQSHEMVDKIENLLYVRDFKKTENSLLNKPGAESKMLGGSKYIRNLIHEVSRIAPVNSPVLLHGESGTGKSLLAEMIHENSLRKSKPFVTINCAAIPSNLLESEFFGHVKGAFTGAIRDKIGKFEYANGGTIFLDEIGDLALGLQAKLLRVLQGHEFEKVGGLKTVKVDVRVITATNQDLMTLIRQGKFREDLFYRLNVLSVDIPTLRERKEDIPVLVEYYVDFYARKFNKPIYKIPKKVMDIFVNYDWPGNVRELKNVLERAVVLSKSGKLCKTDLALTKSIKPPVYEPKIMTTARSPAITNLKDLERDLLIEAIKETKGNISHAATLLNISRDTVYRRLKKYNIGLKSA